MKKTFLILGSVLIIALSSCGSNDKNNNSTSDSLATDTMATDNTNMGTTTDTAAVKVDTMATDTTMKRP